MIKYCKDCKHSKPERSYEWNLYCFHPVIIANSAWALSLADCDHSPPHAMACKDIRKGRWFSKCGLKGKLWETK